MRTCVGCRRTAAKTALVRVVRDPEGDLRVDRTGAAPGRGAYVHPRHECLDRAVARGAIALVRAVRAQARPGTAARLRAEIERERTV